MRGHEPTQPCDGVVLAPQRALVTYEALLMQIPQTTDPPSMVRGMCVYPFHSAALRSRALRPHALSPLKGISSHSASIGIPSTHAILLSQPRGCSAAQKRLCTLSEPHFRCSINPRLAVPVRPCRSQTLISETSVPPVSCNSPIFNRKEVKSSSFLATLRNSALISTNIAASIGM